MHCLSVVTIFLVECWVVASQQTPSGPYEPHRRSYHPSHLAPSPQTGAAYPQNPAYSIDQLPSTQYPRFPFHQPQPQPREQIPKHHDHGKEAPCCLDDAFEDPILSTILFFDKCPSEVTNQTVCEAVSRSLGMPDSALYPREDVDTNALVVPPPNRHSKGTVHFTDSYDIAVVTAGLCFSIYPSVKYGQEVPFECSDTAFADDLTSIFQFASIWTPGDFFNSHSGGGTARAVYVGGNWEGVLDFFVNNDGVVGGCFPTNPLLIGGNVAPSLTYPTGGAIYTLPTNDAAITVLLGGSDPNGRILGSVQLMNKEQVSTAKFEISVKACAISKMIQSRKANGSAELNRRADGDLDFLIACPGDDPFCVVELTEGLVYPDTLIYLTVEVEGPEVVKINVPGRAQIATVQFLGDIANSIPYLWNFYEADTVMLSVPIVWQGSIVAPRASKVILTADVIRGTIVMGHPESHLVTNTVRMPHLDSGEVYCPPSEPSVVLCDCLCRKKKVKK